jgi:pyrroline-5-carboxylate reductase
MYKIGFIGCGNMGGALITAALKTVNGKDIAVCDHNQAKMDKFTAQGASKGIEKTAVAQNGFPQRFKKVNVLPVQIQNQNRSIAKGMYLSRQIKKIHQNDRYKEAIGKI